MSLLPQDNIFYRGDTLELEFQLFKNKSTNEYWDLTDTEIRFELHQDSKSIKKATANVVGGSDNQISIIDESKGIFLIVITSEESTLLPSADYVFEIQITTLENNRYTILHDSLRILPELISWEEI
jgi:hypothetical protein